MISFVIVMVILDILMKIPVADYVPAPQEINKYDNGTAEAYISNNLWEFDNLDDAMEFRELRLTGWKGNAQDFYKWKYEEV